MTRAKRLRDVEDHNLAPREAMILWMQEAHQFDSFVNYGRWLMDQPQDLYPLVRMPGQVVAAVRAHKKDVPDHRLEDHLDRAQKDVLFLFHLHSQINEHAFETEEPRQLRLQLLGERLRTLILRSWNVEREQCKSTSPARAPGRPARRRKKTQEETALERDLIDWPVEEALLWAEVTSLKEAERILSERYMAGESLFFPQTLRALNETLESLEGLYRSYESILGGPPPEADAEIASWIADETPKAKSDSRASAEIDPPLRPPTTRIATCLAQRFLARARAETLGQLGEGDAAARLLQEELCSVRGRPEV